MKKVWEKWTGFSLVGRIVVGLVIGVVLALLVPQASGIAILGDVFVGALKAIAPLLVFFLVTSSLCNAKPSGGKRGGVIGTVIVLYMFSTVLAAVRRSSPASVVTLNTGSCLWNATLKTCGRW